VNVANYDTFIKQSICALLDSKDRPSYCATVDFCNVRVRSDTCCSASCVGDVPNCDRDSLGDSDDEPAVGCEGFLECVFEFFALLFGIV
jgi:hypothetical protein